MALKKKKGQTDTQGNRVREVRENVQETSETEGRGQFRLDRGRLDEENSGGGGGGPTKGGGRLQCTRLQKGERARV